jgi:hypothetical protein
MPSSRPSSPRPPGRRWTPSSWNSRPRWSGTRGPSSTSSGTSRSSPATWSISSRRGQPHRRDPRRALLPLAMAPAALSPQA